MEPQALMDKLTEVFRETLDDPEIVLRRETTAEDLEDWDSVSNIQLLVAVERAFGIKFHTGQIAGLKNVGELADVIAARIRE